jgi:hypothetical protein
MKEKNKAKIGRYLPIAFIIMLLTPITNCVLADDNSYYSLAMPPIPNGMVVTINHQNMTNPIDYGFTEPDGFNDGFQWRQSLLLAVLPSYNTSMSRLNGYTIDFVVYCPIIPHPHSLSFLGNVSYVFEDGHTATYPAGFTMTWTSEGVQMPLVILWEFTTSWIYLTCKNIYISLDYVEDGQFIRHVEKSWINSGDEPSPPPHSVPHINSNPITDIAICADSIATRIGVIPQRQQQGTR